jgi:ComF family protein
MRALLDLLLPPTCPGCGLEGAVLCDPCARPLQRRRDEPPGVPIGLLAPVPPGLVQLEWCAAFSGPVRAALHALKYRGERRLAHPLGIALAERWRRAGRGGELLVPVPVHAARLRERGFDQAEDLARACGHELGVPVLCALERRERTVAQHALSRAERARNVGSAFALRAGAGEAVHGRWIVLVDDVTTTGATLAGCALALLDAGALAVSGLSVARER